MSVLSQRMQEFERLHDRYASVSSRRRNSSAMEYAVLLVVVCACLFYGSHVSGILQRLQYILRVFD